MSGTLIQPKPSAERGSERRRDAWRAVAVCVFLALAVLLVFSPTLRQGFLNYDDGYFVYNEPHVSGGLTWSGIAWAFTNGPLGEWYPLSMLSHMLDCELYGLHPAGHHLTNVLLHAITAVALFLVLWRMTSGLWPSALVAALFALHPLHVESVAWVAERRDVLSGLFFVLALGAYGEYVRRPSLGRYLAVAGLFSLGLMSKAILVTLPALLLLLDYWPLGRFRQMPPQTAAPSERQKSAARSMRQAVAIGTSRPMPSAWRLVLEKLPLLALAIADAGVTMLTHSRRLDPLTLPERLANAAVSCVAYLGQLFVPVGLSIFYSHPEAGLPAWQVAAAVALLLVITAAAVIGRRSYPYFFVGWFWYVGMLVPVLGLTFVGAHSRADRYTYLSQIGLYIALIWGAMRLGAWLPARRWVFGIGSGLMVIALMACSWHQTGYWRDDKTLWDHALDCDPKNVTAHYLLGTVLEDKDESGATAQYEQALEREPNDRNIYYKVRAKAHDRLGSMAVQKGDAAGAKLEYELALEADPDFAPAHMNLGGLLAKQGKLEDAKIHFRRSVDLSPDSAAAAYCNLAIALSGQDQTDEAIVNYRKALEADRNLGIAHMNLAALLAGRGVVDEAILHYQRAIDIDPNVAFPYYQLARLLSQQGKTNEAAKYQQQGIQTSRRFAESQNLRGTELAEQGKITEAISQFQTAIAVAPDYALAHCNLAKALESQGDIDGANLHYREALKNDPRLAPARQGLERLNH